MEKIDRLGWAAGIAIVCYGVRVGVRVSDPALMDEVLRRLPPGWKPAKSPVVEKLFSIRVGGEKRPGSRGFHLLYAESTRAARSLDLNEVLDVFESGLQLYVAAMARGRVFVHAGVVEWKGQAILVPGSTFAGKSTLIAALVRAGATYYSDEYAVLDGQGRVHPFPKPLNLRPENGEPGLKCSAEELGGKTGRKPIPAGLVVMTEYRPGSRWRPRVLSPGQATLALLSHTVPARRDPERALAALKEVAATAVTVKSPRGDADDLTKTLLLTIQREVEVRSRKLSA
jgi:hypothetical protein